MIARHSLDFSRMHIPISLLLSKAGVYRYVTAVLEKYHV